MIDMPSTSQPHSSWRTVLTFIGSAAAAAAFMLLDNSQPVGVLVAAGLLLVAPLLNMRASLGPKIVARAFWWQAALLGVLIAVGGSTSHSNLGLLMSLASVVALIAAGRSGLDSPSASFVPVAFRRTLMLSLILAIADLQALLLYGSIFFEESFTTSRNVTAWPFFIAALAMALSVMGLYRLKVWGLVACLLSNVAIAACAIAGVFALPTALVVGLTSTAVIQLLLPIPLLRQMARTRRLT